VLLAVLKAGGAYLPLDPDYPAERLAFMLADSGARLVATDSRLAALLPDRLPSVLLDRLDGAASAADLPAASPANLAYVIYTSGTTGVPKGVAVTHRGIASLVRAQSGAFGIRGRVRVLQLAPLSFDASVAEILVTLLAGGTLVLLPGGERVAAAWRALRSGEVDVATVPPALLEGVEPAPALRTLVVAGEACPVETAAAWSQACRLVNAYGPTETTVCATLHVATAEVREALPIGRPIANTTAHVVDRDGNLVAPGVPGELLIGGAGLARGYLGRPGSTAERFVPNPFAGDGSRLYRSGDRVRRREEGAIEFLGRLDDQVKVRGYRVEPAEVETAIRRHPDVTAAAVVLRTLPATGEALVAYVTGPRIVSPAGLRAFLAERLPAHMLPSVCVQLPSLPLLPSGKVDRASLPLPDATGGGRAAPRNPVEQLVHDLWVELLGAEQIGVQDDFFQLGGQSLVAARFIARVRELLDVELPFTALFDAPVLEDVAATIAAACLAQPEEVLAQS
jgi:amino acid adenylation domain-containing protein